MAFNKSEQVSFIVLIAISLMALSTLCQVIGLASNHWVDTISDEYGMIGYNGLWQVCSNFGLAQDSCRGFRWTDVQVSHWFRTVQAVETLGFILGITALFMVLLKYFVETCFTNRLLKPISAFLLSLSFLLVLSGGAIIGSHKDVQKAIEMEATTSMSWSFGFSIVACILYLASVIALCIAQ